MSYLYLVQLLASTFGYKQYIADNSKTSLLDFAYFRTRLCKFLFKNAEKIAEGLPASPGSAYGKICFDAKHFSAA